MARRGRDEHAVRADASSTGCRPAICTIDAAFQLDQLSMVMMLVITGVGTLIHIFSIGYMQRRPGLSALLRVPEPVRLRSCCVLVLGASYPVLFVGWEGVGLCSYLLIGFWFSEKANADAGKKAFIVNRIGDFGFLIAMFLLFANLGTLDFAGVRRGGAIARLRQRARHDDLPLPVPRLRGQERADPALRLAARRHGRPDAGLRADPRGDDGHRRRLPHRAQRRSCSRWRRSRMHRRGGRSARSRRSSRRRSASSSGTSRRCSRTRRSRSSATCSSASASGAYAAGDVPPRDARVLQGAAVPRLRLGDLRDAPRVSPHAATTRTRRTCATWAGCGSTCRSRSC